MRKNQRMPTSIKELIHQISTIGTNHYSYSNLILKVRIMNNVIFVSMIMGLSCVAIGLYEGDVIYTLVTFFVSLIFLLCLFLVQKKKIEPAWYIMLTVPVLILTSLPLISDTVITIILYYIVFQTLVFALFDKRIIVVSFSIFYTINALLFLHFFYETHESGLITDNFFSTGANLIIGIFLEFLTLLIVLAIREEQSKAFQLKEATFKSIFENSPIGVIVSHRKENTSKMINERMALMFG